VFTMDKEKVIDNKYSRADAAKIFEYICQLTKQAKNFDLGNQILFNSTFMKNNLLKVLLGNYRDCEKLGGSNQFYEKYSYRQFIIHTIQFLKKNDYYNNQFVTF